MKPTRLTYKITPTKTASNHSGDRPYEVHADALEFSSQGAAIFVFFLEEIDGNRTNMDEKEPLYVPRPALVLQSDQWSKIEEIVDGKPLHSCVEPVFTKKPERTHVKKEA